MNFLAVYLDSHPLGLIAQKPGKSQEADDCQAWFEGLVRAGVRVVIPAIADYEVRRELVRNKNTGSVARLTALRQRADFLPLSQEALERAADLWAKGRNTGRATADPHALDGDAILSAQVLTDNEEMAFIAVATINVKHLVRYVPNADLWENVTP